MDTKLIRQLLREGATVVLLEEGSVPLVVRELVQPDGQAPEETPEEVPIASRWPKGRTIHDGPPKRMDAPPEPEPSRSDQILERLNKEILALKAEIAQQEEQGAAGEGIH